MPCIEVLRRWWASRQRRADALAGPRSGGCWPIGAKRLAAAHRPQTGGGAAGRSAWQHPWVEEVGKEGYNLLAELASALDARAYRDACQVIANAAEPLSEGLLPDATDPRLFVSLPRGRRVCGTRSSGAVRVLGEGFGQTALLRLRGAAADDDVTGVQAIADQFYGTPAAAESQRWLGDRALAGGSVYARRGHIMPRHCILLRPKNDDSLPRGCG